MTVLLNHTPYQDHIIDLVHHKPDLLYLMSNLVFHILDLLYHLPNLAHHIPTRGNLFLPVRLLVWANRRGTVARADCAARAELIGAPKQKLLQQKNIEKYNLLKHREMLICCFDVSPDM
jgi:hypothetical protein